MEDSSKNAGFSVVEVCLTLLILIGLGLVSYLLVSRVYQQRSGVSPAARSLTPPGWVRYKSARSPIQFFYPPSWKLVQDKHDKSATNILESVNITGTHNFQIFFVLNKPGPNIVQCRTPSPTTQVTLNKMYALNLEYSDASKQEVKSMSLVQQNPSAMLFSNCQDFNKVSDTIGFTFTGEYVQDTNDNQSGYIFKPASGYLNLPEVQTAKVIFTSLQQ